MVGRVEFEPTAIGLKVRNGEIKQFTIQPLTGIPVATNAQMIRAKLTQRECKLLPGAGYPGDYVPVRDHSRLEDPSRILQKSRKSAPGEALYRR